jgi:hypothetical protein
MDIIERAGTVDEHSSPEPRPATADRLPSPAHVRAKDRLSMAVVLSAASIAWFGWGHQGLRLESSLRGGMVAAAIVLLVAILLVRRVPAPPTLATDPQARKVYWAAVIAEVALIVAGAVVLAKTGQSMFLSTWVLLVVGIHFLPFVRAFNTPLLRHTALGCVLVAALALWAGLTGWAPAPTVAGAGGGVVLLGFALALMRQAPQD